jgi:hypothetical protein
MNKSAGSSQIESLRQNPNDRVAISGEVQLLSGLAVTAVSASP